MKQPTKKKEETFMKFQQVLHFQRMDELMDYYLVFEKSFILNSLLKGVLQDNQEFVTLVNQQLNQQAKQKTEESRKDEANKSSASTEGDKNAALSIFDLIDNFSFILDKSFKRALMTFSLVNTCAVFNFINDILSEQLLNFFKIRFLIFTGLVQ